jgi:hypothetical protein
VVIRESPRPLILIGDPGNLGQGIRPWSKLNKKHRTKVDDEYSPSRNEEYLLYAGNLDTLVATDR